MSTSGSSDFSIVGAQIIQLAFSLVGVGTQGETLSAEDQAEGLMRLNLMVKSWQAERVYLFKKKDAVLFLTAGQARYQFGNSGSRAAVSWAETTLGALAPASSVTITPTSVTGISAGDQIGILLDNNLMHWTTVNGAPSGQIVTLTTAIPSQAGAGRKVFAYTDIMARPLRVLDAQRRSASDIDLPLDPMSRTDYRDLPNKFTRSTPVQYYYDPQPGTAFLNIWPTASDEASTIRFSAAMPLEDFDLTTNDPDFPQEWIEALAYDLAVRLVPSYGDALPVWQVQYITNQAAMLKDTVRNWDEDQAPVQFTPSAHYGDR